MNTSTARKIAEVQALNVLTLVMYQWLGVTVIWMAVGWYGAIVLIIVINLIQRVYTESKV